MKNKYVVMLIVETNDDGLVSITPTSIKEIVHSEPEEDDDGDGDE